MRKYFLALLSGVIIAATSTLHTFAYTSIPACSFSESSSLKNAVFYSQIARSKETNLSTIAYKRLDGTYQVHVSKDPNIRVKLDSATQVVVPTGTYSSQFFNSLFEPTTKVFDLVRTEDYIMATTSQATCFAFFQNGYFSSSYNPSTYPIMEVYPTNYNGSEVLDRENFQIDLREGIAEFVPIFFAGIIWFSLTVWLMKALSGKRRNM